MQGLKPCVVGIVLATGIYMIGQNCLSGASVDILSLVITAVLAAVMLLYKRVAKKKISPILLITLSAVIGMIAYI